MNLVVRILLVLVTLCFIGEGTVLYEMLPSMGKETFECIVVGIVCVVIFICVLRHEKELP